MRMLKYFFIILLLIFVFMITGCKKDSPEYVLEEFYRLIKAGNGSQAFQKYVDLRDLSILLGYSPKSDDLVEENNDELHQNRNHEAFQKFWNQNADELNNMFLKQISNVDSFSIIEKKEISSGYLIIVKTLYIGGKESLEEVELKKADNSYKIKLSTLKEVKDDV